MVQKRYIKCTVVVHFARQVPLRRILPDLSPVFAIKGPLCGLFHFWHSPCFISIVLAAAITEY